jgi:ribosomal protein S18 acetylase RimI-like enzyme
MTLVVPFAAPAAAVVSSWATTAAEVAAWCSRSEAPVPPEVIVEWSTPPDVRAYLLVDTDATPVAYGELWIDDDEHEVELARIIVDPNRRGRRFGRRFVAELATMAQTIHPATIMRVQPGNDTAVACYRAAGFRRLDPDAEREWNQGQPTAYLWMTR